VPIAAESTGPEWIFVSSSVESSAGGVSGVHGDALGVAGGTLVLDVARGAIGASDARAPAVTTSVGARA